MLQHFGYNASSPLAINLPEASSGHQVVAFAIGVTDRSKVDLKCQLSGSGDTRPLSYAPGFALNKEYPCSSPQVFSIVSAGEFEFSVTGTDAVGNVEQEPVSHSFNISYAEGNIHALVDTPFWGLTNSSVHEVSLKAITGTPDGRGMTVAASQQFQVSIANLSRTLPAQALQWLPSPWADVSGSTHVFKVLFLPAYAPASPQCQLVEDFRWHAWIRWLYVAVQCMPQTCSCVDMQLWP